jgi:hypothetical protein
MFTMVTSHSSGLRVRAAWPPRAALRPLPERRFELVTWHKARVHQDSHVVFDKRLYSVPWRLIGQLVWLRASPTTILVFADDARVAMHDQRCLLGAKHLR